LNQGLGYRKEMLDKFRLIFNRIGVPIKVAKEVFEMNVDFMGHFFFVLPSKQAVRFFY